MKISEFFLSKDSIQLDKKTLVTLRWIALAGQYLTINIVSFILKFQLPFFLCSLVIFVGVISNFYLQFIFKKNEFEVNLEQSASNRFGRKSRFQNY